MSAPKVGFTLGVIGYGAGLIPLSVTNLPALLIATMLMAKRLRHQIMEIRNGNTNESFGLV